MNTTLPQIFSKYKHPHSKITVMAAAVTTSAAAFGPKITGGGASRRRGSNPRTSIQPKKSQKKPNPKIIANLRDWYLVILIRKSVWPNASIIPIIKNNSELIMECWSLPTYKESGVPEQLGVRPRGNCQYSIANAKYNDEQPCGLVRATVVYCSQSAKPCHSLIAGALRQ